MKIGFVIVNYNDYETTIKLIDNIKNYKCLDEIVVVDNNSTDDSYKELSKLSYDNLKVISSSVNGGYSSALNIGCKYLIDKYKKLKIFISNSDIEISKEKDLLDMCDLLSDDIVIVGPNIDTHGEISRGWKIPTPMDEILFNLPIVQDNIIKKNMYEDNKYIGDKTYVDTVSGCFFLIDSKHLENINYFDEKVFLYYEENIFGIKTKNINKIVVIANNVTIKHNHSVSIDKSMNRLNKYKIQKRSQEYFEKHYNKANELEMMLLFFTSSITKGILYIKYKLEGMK